MDPLPENEISERVGVEESQWVLDRLRRNDPALKELTLFIPKLPSASTITMNQMIFQAFHAIATNTSLEILNIEGIIVFFLIGEDTNNRVTTALSLNSSLKDIRIATPGWWGGISDIVVASPNLEALTIRYDSFFAIEDITTLAEVLRMDTNLQSLTIEGFRMGSYQGAAFAKAFPGNRAIKTLIMKRSVISMAGAVSFVEALPHDHSLEEIVFDEGPFDDDSAVSIVRTLCHTPLKVLSLVDSRGFNKITPDGCERIIRALKENEHSFTKLELFPDSKYPPWLNGIRLEIELLTWNKRLQVEKDTWVDQFLEQAAHTQEVLLLALERANKVDKEAPNMLFFLIKELPDLITDFASSP